MDGTAHEIPEGYTLQFECWFDHPVEKVWAALTEPERIAEWLAPGEIQPSVGGRAYLDFPNSDAVVDGRVTAVEPPRLLEYTWVLQGEDMGLVRWELSTEQGSTRLVLTHTMPSAARRPGFLAGWHLHLELLSTALDGQPRSWPSQRWEMLRDHYAGVVD